MTTYVLLRGYGPGAIVTVHATRDAADEAAEALRRRVTRPAEVRVTERHGTHYRWTDAAWWAAQERKG